MFYSPEDQAHYRELITGSGMTVEKISELLEVVFDMPAQEQDGWVGAKKRKKTSPYELGQIVAVPAKTLEKKLGFKKAEVETVLCLLEDQRKSKGEHDDDDDSGDGGDESESDDSSSRRASSDSGRSSSGSGSNDSSSCGNGSSSSNGRSDDSSSGSCSSSNNGGASSRRGRRGCPYVELLPSVHNIAQIAFHRTTPDEIRRSNDVIDYILTRFKRGQNTGMVVVNSGGANDVDGSDDVTVRDVNADDDAVVVVA